MVYPVKKNNFFFKILKFQCASIINSHFFYPFLPVNFLQKYFMYSIFNFSNILIKKRFVDDIKIVTSDYEEFF